MWDHTKDPYLHSFMNPEQMTDGDKTTLKTIICILCDNKDSKDACDKIYKILESQSRKTSIIPIILQLIGSTRRKMLTDLTAMLSKQGIRVPSKNPENISENKELLPYAEKYLTDEMRRIFAAIIEKNCEIDDDTLFMIFEILHQATWGGWIRQERAKRSGHYAEYRLAEMLGKFGIPFEPMIKREDPIMPDVQIDHISYDLVVPNKTNSRMCFKCTVHTSNMGQYGESKDSLEVKEAKDSIKRHGRGMVLVSLVDGVGLKSNMAGLESVLENSDEFCQFETFWKVVVIFASITGRKVRLCIPDPEKHAGFLGKYGESVIMAGVPQAGFVRVGEADLELAGVKEN